VQPAGRAVEAVEHDPLQRRVDPSGAPVARVAGVRDRRRGLVQRAEAELDRDEGDSGKQQRDEELRQLSLRR